MQLTIFDANRQELIFTWTLKASEKFDRHVLSATATIARVPLQRRGEGSCRGANARANIGPSLSHVTEAIDIIFVWHQVRFIIHLVNHSTLTL